MCIRDREPVGVQGERRRPALHVFHCVLFPRFVVVGYRLGGARIVRVARRPRQVTVPSCQGMNSSWPMSSSSLTVRSPDATAMMRSKISSPTWVSPAVPSTIRPQLMSMSSAIRWYICVLVASLIDGVGRHPNTDPRPCLLYTSDAADDLTRVDLGGRR